MSLPLDICIDTSDNQERRAPIDWPAVYADGIRIAFIKIMQDPMARYSGWEAQVTGARAAGIFVIPYAFLVPADPASYAKEFAVRADPLEPGGAFMLDWEGRASQTCTPPVAEAIGRELAARYGRDPIGYWGLPGSTPAMPTEIMLGWPRTVPRYPNGAAEQFDDLPERDILDPILAVKTERGGLPVFWQYTANGKVKGITGPVDRSVAFFPTEADAIAWCAGKGPQR